MIDVGESIHIPRIVISAGMAMNDAHLKGLQTDWAMVHIEDPRVKESPWYEEGRATPALGKKFLLKLMQKIHFLNTFLDFQDQTTGKRMDKVQDTSTDKTAQMASKSSNQGSTSIGASIWVDIAADAGISSPGADKTTGTDKSNIGKKKNKLLQPKEEPMEVDLPQVSVG